MINDFLCFCLFLMSFSIHFCFSVFLSIFLYRLSSFFSYFEKFFFINVLVKFIFLFRCYFFNVFLSICLCFFFFFSFGFLFSYSAALFFFFHISRCIFIINSLFFLLWCISSFLQYLSFFPFPFIYFFLLVYFCLLVSGISNFSCSPFLNISYSGSLPVCFCNFYI